MVQTIAGEERQTPDQYRGCPTDQLLCAGLRARPHHQREDQTRLRRERDPDPDGPIVARLALRQPR